MHLYFLRIIRALEKRVWSQNNTIPCHVHRLDVPLNSFVFTLKTFVFDQKPASFTQQTKQTQCFLLTSVFLNKCCFTCKYLAFACIIFAFHLYSLPIFFQKHLYMKFSINSTFFFNYLAKHLRSPKQHFLIQNLAFSKKKRSNFYLPIKTLRWPRELNVQQLQKTPAN